MDTLKFNELNDMTEYDLQIHTFLDTEKTIKIKIADILGTQPRYLYFPPDNVLSINNFIEVFNLEKMIEQYDIFQKIFNIEYVNNLSEEELISLIELFLVKNEDKIKKNIKMVGGNSKLILISFFNDINFVEKYKIQEMWEDIRNTKHKLVKIIEKNRIEIDKINADIELINSFKSLLYTEFEFLEMNFIIELNFDNMSLIEIFNKIQSSEEFPFSYYDNFYKIYKNFIPSEEWIQDRSDEYILVKIKNNSRNYNDYYNFIINKNNDKIEGQCKISFDKKSISYEEYIDNIKNIFSNERIITNIEQNNIKSVFYFPNLTLDIYVFSDIVMNDDIFSTMFNIDESRKATKDRNSLYIHFEHPNFPKINFSISEEVNKLNQSTIKIKIHKVLNEEIMEKFRHLLSIFMNIYVNNKEKITNIYKSYIKNFGKNKKISVVSKKKKKVFLKDLDKNIFSSSKGQTFSRSCPKLPTIIQEDEVIEQQQHVMKFPKENIEGIEQRYYVCNHDKHIYPGLIKYPNKIGYAPCCFKINQQEKENSNYNNYMNNVTTQNKRNRQQDIIITNKFVSLKKYGKLPEDLKNIFIDSKIKKYKYLRTGGSSENNSLLNCVYLAINKDFKLYKERDVDEYLNIQRMKISNDILNISLCKQEMFDLEINEIQDIIQDSNKYFDPTLFIPMLEEIYNINIYLFRRDVNNKCTIVIPRHIQGFYRKSNEKKCIFIYEHSGGEFDSSKYPKCELIVKWNVEKRKNNVKYVFDKYEDISVKVDQIYTQLRYAYSGNKYIDEDKYNLEIEVYDQFIDSFGKTRMLRINYENNLINILTSPMTPLRVTSFIFEETDIIKHDIDVIIKFVKELNFIILGQVLNNKGKISYLLCKMGNIKISIPIDETSSQIPEIEIVRNNDLKLLNKTNKSYLEIYNTNKRFARYIYEYILWFFSHYLNKKRQQNEERLKDEDEINNFIRINTLIDEDFKYGNIRREFKFDNSSLVKNNKIVFKSIEILERIKFMLKRDLIRHEDEILLYYRNTNIVNYFLDITDFTKNNFQNIFKGQNTIFEIITNKKNEYELKEHVDPYIYKPYFLKNELIDDNIYLVQNSDSLKKALYISKIWKKYKYNPENVKEYSKKIKFILYMYENQRYKKHIFYDTFENYDIKIIAYKMNETFYFSSLLKL